MGIEAQKKGCQQVLWLFGEEEYLTEAGTMNMFLVTKNKKGGKKSFDQIFRKNQLNLKI